MATPERTLDQRLEALTTSLELLAGLYRDRERVLYDFMRETRDSNRHLLATVQVVSSAITLMSSSLEKLTRVAENQEARLVQLESEKGRREHE
jgi:hypothetical protein